jgi:hypothetical protein
MPSTTSARTRRNGRPLKSPLAVASSRICPGAPAAGAEETRPVPAIALSEREATINAYVSPARHLDGWMGKQGTGSDFTAIDTALLNRYFREYYRQHGALAWHGPRATGSRTAADRPIAASSASGPTRGVGSGASATSCRRGGPWCGHREARW